MKWKGLVKVKYIKYNSLDIPNDSEVQFHNSFNRKIKNTNMDPKTKVTCKICRELWHTFNVSYFYS